MNVSTSFVFTQQVDNILGKNICLLRTQNSFSDSKRAVLSTGPAILNIDDVAYYFLFSIVPSKAIPTNFELIQTPKVGGYGYPVFSRHIVHRNLYF